MKPALTSPIWTATTLLLAVLVFALGVTLIFSVRQKQRELLASVSLISRIDELEQSVRELAKADTTIEQPIAPELWPALYSKYRNQADALDMRDPAVGEIRELLLRMDSSVKRMNELHASLLRARPASPERRTLEMEFHGETIRAIDDMRAAVEVVRRRLVRVSSELGGKWRNLNILVWTACLLAILLYTYQRYIVKLKRAEEALRESEKKYRTLFEESKDMVYIATPEGRFVDVNPAGLELLGYSSKDELMNLDVARELFVDGPEWEGEKRELARLGFVKDRELVLRRKDGQKLSVLDTATAMRNERGTVVGYRGIIRDVTEQKQLEEELRQSQKMEAIGKLAGGMAHDFNNLMTAITGYSELLLGRLSPGDPLCEDLEEIKKAGERAALLTRQLLAFSRRQVLQPKVVDLNAAVSNLEGMLRRLMGEDIELITILKPDLRPVKADPGQIEQVIMNLAVNARDAMPIGGKVIIETADVDLDQSYTRRRSGVTPGSYVMLAVSDTGTGMDSETQSHIFEPFFTTKEKGKGTGLGLSTVYGIIKQSGGDIWVYSELGMGTTFKIYLPWVQETVKAPAPKVVPTAVPRGSETILLVEDEESVRTLVRGILQMNGYTVLEARFGGEALLMCEQHKGPIHLMVTDVVMPQMSGREVAERLAPSRPDMKVLYLSGYTDDAIVHHGVLDAGTAFLQKPFTPGALAHKVREVLDSPPPAVAG